MTDRNVFTSLLKDSGKVSELEWQLYEEWFGWLTDHFKSITPRAYIYLKADPNISYQRMVNRTREEEQSVTLEYIKSVSDKHDKWLLETECSPVETIEVNRDFVNDTAFRDAVMGKIGTVIDSKRQRIASSGSEKSFEELLDAVCR